MFFRFSAPKIGGVLIKTFSKGSFTRFFQNMALGGGVYQISPDVALTTCIQLYSKRTQKAISWTHRACSLDSAPPKKGGSSQKPFQKAHLPVFSKKWPRGGGAFYQISPDVALTTCRQLYSERTQKTIFWTPEVFVLDSAAPK